MSSEPGREYILKELIENVRSSYDYIIIDSPSLGLLTINSFTAADEIIIHCKRNFLAMQVWPSGRSS
jgi:chromosome partitioning protein